MKNSWIYESLNVCNSTDFQDYGKRLWENWCELFFDNERIVNDPLDINDPAEMEGTTYRYLHF